MNSDKNNQNKMVLTYMRTNGSITSVEAFTSLGITRLSARIHDLKRMGYDIAKETIKSVNKCGNFVHYASYRVVENM